MIATMPSPPSSSGAWYVTTISPPMMPADHQRRPPRSRGSPAKARSTHGRNAPNTTISYDLRGSPNTHGGTTASTSATGAGTSPRHIRNATRTAAETRTAFPVPDQRPRRTVGEVGDARENEGEQRRVLGRHRRDEAVHRQ